MHENCILAFQMASYLTVPWWYPDQKVMAHWSWHWDLISCDFFALDSLPPLVVLHHIEKEYFAWLQDECVTAFSFLYLSTLVFYTYFPYVLMQCSCYYRISDENRTSLSRRFEVRTNPFSVILSYCGFTTLHIVRWITNKKMFVIENLHSILSLGAPTYIGGASNVVVQVQTTDLKGPTELCPWNLLMRKIYNYSVNCCFPFCVFKTKPSLDKILAFLFYWTTYGFLCDSWIL